MSSPGAGRWAALDVFRGLTIAGMILVNTPGNRTAYGPLKHAAWNGCTAADLVFPFFLFASGVAMGLSLPKRAARMGRAQALKGALKRAGLIVVLGLFLNSIPNWRPSTLRLPGVLQRIGACAALTAPAALWLSAPAQAGAAAAILVGYHGVLAAGPQAAEDTIPARLDRRVFGRAHLYGGGAADPEGLLSTLPAAATMLLGLALVGMARDPRRLALAGGALAALGWAWSWSLPFNKALWTSSYAVWTAGLAALSLAACGFVESVPKKAWTWVAALGESALAAYILPILMLKALVYTRIAGEQPRLWLCARLFETWLPSQAASFAFGLAYLAGWSAVFTALRRRGILLKL